jgi:hypothetical protein
MPRLTKTRTDTAASRTVARDQEWATAYPQQFRTGTARAGGFDLLRLSRWGIARA